MDANTLVAAIEDAFARVKLEDGVGVFEAEAIDDYASEEQRAKASENDIRDDWRKIPDEVVSAHYSAMAFMDQKGLRYAIPAYMRFAIKYCKASDSASIDHIIYALAVEQDWDFLDEKQKQAIADFLNYMVLEVGEDYVDSYQASLAYENYWAPYSTQAQTGH